MERNVKVYRVHRALSWLYGALAAGFLALLFISLLGPARDSNSGAGYGLLIFGVLFLIHQIAARGARGKKPWARITSLAIAFFMLFAFPVGTLIAGYLFLNGWQRWTNDETRSGQTEVTQ